MEICCDYLLAKDLLALKEEEQAVIVQRFEKHEFSMGQNKSYG